MPKSILTVWCLAILASGCGGSNEPRTPDQVDQDNLSQVGELYRHYQFTKKKPPQKFADLNTVRTLGGNGYEAIRTGNIVLLYGATLPDTAEEPGETGSDQVLAHQKDVPSNGGYVLMLNRTVKKMTAEEFQTAPKPAGATAGNRAPSQKK
jgi:hypothetical protein